MDAALGGSSKGGAGLSPRMEITEALAFAARHRNGVLTTIRNDSRPQQSNILFQAGDDGVIRISITADRAKFINIARRPWAALHVSSDDFWQYAVLEGDAELSAVAADPHDEAVEELVTLYRNLLGEHEDWEDYRRAMVRDRRVVVRIRPNRAYGMMRMPQ